TACEGMNNKDRFAIGGMLAGAAAGAALASGAGNSQYAGLAAVGGALVGGMIGLFVGIKLDEAERIRAEAAAVLAANTDKRQYWTSPKRPDAVSGYAEPIDD